MARSSASFVAVLLVALVASASAGLPPSWKVCKRSDPGLNACLLNSFNTAIPELIKGSAELGIAPLNPLKIPVIDFEEHNGGTDMSLKVKNAKFVGLPGKTTSVNAELNDFKPMKLSFVQEVDLLTVSAEYELNAKIMALVVSGSGDMENNFKTVRLEITVEGNANGEFLDVTDVETHIHNGQVIIQFNNLFNGNKELSDATNKQINDNWDDVWKETGRSFEVSFAGLVKQVATSFFHKVPLSDIFPK